MKVGFVQNQPVFGDAQENLQRLEEILGDAVADLLVLPELFATGYQFANMDEVVRQAEPLPGGPTCERLIALAKSKNTFFIAGIAERERDSIYNSAVIVGPEGYIGKYRKAHIFDTEKQFFLPGNLPLPVFDIGIARVGIMICFDWRFPEAARTLAIKGADVIAHPCNLVLPHCPQAMITRCLENRVFAVTADRVGSEERVPGRALQFIGQSQVVDPDGEILCRASIDQEEIGVVEIDIEKARDKRLTEHNLIFEDRRTDLYELN